MIRKLLARFFLLLACALPLAGGPALAQVAHATASAAAPHIHSFDVDAVGRLDPGTELHFTLQGSPGAVATIAVDGARRRVPLEETRPGVYEGTYPVSSRDRIAPDGHVTANLRLGNRVATAVLDEPLVAGAARRDGWNDAGAQRRDAAAAPRIDSFGAEPAATLATGQELTFWARGTPGAQASVNVPGARRFFLQETGPGVYEGSYIVRERDRIDTSRPVTLRLVTGDAAVTRDLDRPLVAASEAPRRTARRQVAACPDCATVVAVNPVEVRGAGSYVGPIAGGVVGALLGSQIGSGSGRTAAGVAGAVGGAIAGREIERHVGKTTHYEVVVRLEGGGQQTFTYETDPGLAVGTRVRVADGRLVRER